MDDTKSCYQLIMNITISEDLRKDKKPVKISENSPIYYLSLCLKFGFLRHSCRCYGDYIEVCDCFISNAVLILNSIFDCPITDCPITNYPITEAI